MIKVFKKSFIFIACFFVMFFVCLFLPKTVKAIDCYPTDWGKERCDSWQDQGCGTMGCPSNQMGQSGYCCTCYSVFPTNCGRTGARCRDSVTCQPAPTPTPINIPSCNGVYVSGYCCPYTWISGSCGGGSCTSKQRYQYQWCTSLSGSGTWKHEQCVSDTSCGGSGGTTTICGDIGGDKCIHDSSGCPAGYTSLGQTSDCVSCCKSSSEGSTGGGCTLGEWSASRCATCKSNRTWNANCTDYGSASTWCACASWCDPAAYAANTACGGSPIPGGFTCP